jgi:hypothetical protein
MEFIGEAIARPSAACPGRIATLDHKIGDDPVEKGAIKETLLGEKNKIVHRFGGFICKELQLDIPFIGMTAVYFCFGSMVNSGGLDH